MNPFDTNYIKLKETKILEVINKKKTVVQIAEELNVTRKTIHKWNIRYQRFGIDGLLHKKKKGCPSPHNKTTEEHETIIIEMSKKYWQDGVEILHDRIQFEYNLTFHPSTIFRILKRNKIRYTDSYTRTQRQWKKRLYAHDTPGKELQIDTTYPFGYKEGKVIYTAIDDATRFVFTKLYTTANTENTLDFLHQLITRLPFTIQKIRSDQGKEFVAKRVKSFLLEQGIEQRSNTPYSPEENGKIERFHRTLHEKCYPFGFYPRVSFDELQYKLTLFVYYYNYQKRHRGLGMDGLTPYQKLMKCKKV